MKNNYKYKVVEFLNICSKRLLKQYIETGKIKAKPHSFYCSKEDFICILKKAIEKKKITQEKVNLISSWIIEIKEEMLPIEKQLINRIEIAIYYLKQGCSANSLKVAIGKARYLLNQEYSQFINSLPNDWQSLISKHY